MTPKTVLAVLLSVCLLGLPVVSTGCATWNQDKAEQITHNTLKAVAVSVDAALNAYAEVYVAGRVAEDKHAQVVSAHNKYRAAMATAIAAARLDLNQPSPAEVSQLATALVALIQEVL